jgi:predicted nucleic acid-binding protein
MRTVDIQTAFWIVEEQLAHDLIVVTRNRADFEHARVKVLDPFARL